MPPAARPPTLRTVESPVSLPSFADLDALNAFTKGWKEPALCRTATQAVSSSGQATAPDLAIIADIPDTAEDASGQAFTGPYNQLIRKALAAAGFNLESCYFTYLSKWRTPGQRNLSDVEMSWLIPLLRAELGFVQPRAILLLGDSVSRAIFSPSSQKDKILTKNTFVEIQWLEKSLPILSSQKSEILVKNISMKKSFWFSLIAFAATLRAEGFLADCPPGVNNTEHKQ